MQICRFVYLIYRGQKSAHSLKGVHMAKCNSAFTIFLLQIIPFKTPLLLSHMDSCSLLDQGSPTPRLWPLLGRGLFGIGLHKWLAGECVGAGATQLNLYEWRAGGHLCVCVCVSLPLAQVELHTCMLAYLSCWPTTWARALCVCACMPAHCSQDSVPLSSPSWPAKAAVLDAKTNSMIQNSFCKRETIGSYVEFHADGLFSWKIKTWQK